ncbi:hypothetical protein EBU95_21470, partial [bacterium]|nr:hypothetical protein [bacterium]
ADKILLMSATIIDPQHFAKTLGITDFEYIEVDSTFDSKKSPIYVLAKNKLNARNLHEKLPSICQLITKICESHSNEKGLIHTHTHEITKFLQLNLKGNRWLFREPGVTNEDILKIHAESNQSTVLVSPSMVFGVDLKGKLATFQIVIKAPYLPLLDKRIKKMFELDKTWYENKMISSFIQACGRGTRSKEDTCITYVLDGNIADVIIRCKSKIPKCFLDRVQ